MNLDHKTAIEGTIDDAGFLLSAFPSIGHVPRLSLSSTAVLADFYAVTKMACDEL